MKVVATQYVDIIFCDESLHTAQLVIENVDNLFEQAFLELGSKQKIRFPIVISPDSDNLVISYSPIPYNRIIIFDAVPTAEMACYENTILSLLYHEITKAVNYSVTFKFAQVIKNVFRVDSLQPIPLLNIPFSIVEGWSFIEESKDGNGRMNDFFFLEQLSVAKFENKFPDWMQVSVKKELKRENDLSYAAGAAFIAFIQQRWGMEKFLEFWNESGNINFFRLMAGNFKKVYGVSLSSAWKDFVEVIPLPSDIEQIIELEKYTSKLIKNDTEGAAKNIINTPYGLVWYDDIRHEVDILDLNSEVKNRKLLFLASDITRLSLSPDGRFLAVSFTELGSREQFKNDVTWIFDLEERRFLKESYNLRESAILQLENKKYAIIGVDTKEKFPVIKSYTIPSINKIYDVEGSSIVEIYERDFDYNTIPTSILSYDDRKFCCIVNDKNNYYLLFSDIDKKEEILYQIIDKDLGRIQIKELNFFDTEDLAISFMYLPNDEIAFTRFGLINFDSNKQIKNIQLQKQDVQGGVCFPVFFNDDVYYAANRLTYNELKIIPYDLIQFKEVEYERVLTELSKQSYTENFVKYDIKSYLPFKYWFSGSVRPFLPVYDINLDEGPKMWPGLGLTYLTSMDPLENTEMTLSAGFGFLKLNLEFITTSKQSKFLYLLNGQNDFYKDWIMSVYLKNTSTPVDIGLGSVFAFIPDKGTYDWDIIATTSWLIPFGMSFRNLKLDIQSHFNISTSFYDSNRDELFPNLANWPSPEKAYKTLLIQSNAVYSNIHQYGLSEFEQRGISIGSTLFAFWDVNKTERIIKEKKENQKNSKNDKSQSFFLESLSSVEALSLGLSVDIAIPRLTPLKMYKGFVLSFPANIMLDVYKEVGTALRFGIEILPFGFEIKKGVPVLNLFFNKLGIKIGYYGSFVYDTNSTQLPNVLNIETLKNVFLSSTYMDFVTISLDFDFIPVIGTLSETKFNSSLDFYYYIKQKVVKFQLRLEFLY